MLRVKQIKNTGKAMLDAEFQQFPQKKRKENNNLNYGNNESTYCERQLPSHFPPSSEFEDFFGKRLQQRVESHPHQLHHPKRFLNDSLQSKVLFWTYWPIVKCEVKDEWWTSSVANPLTGEKFWSELILIGEEVGVPKDTRGFSIALHEAKTMLHKTRVYYRTKQHAEYAAAARALTK